MSDIAPGHNHHVADVCVQEYCPGHYMNHRPRLVCTSSAFPESVIEYPVDRHLRPIYDLLANGVNVSVTLTKDDGGTFTYTLDRTPLVPSRAGRP